VMYAGVSATLLAGLGFLLGYMIQRRSLPIWRWLDDSTFFLFTLPGTVLGVGLITLWNRPSFAWLYTSPFILVIAFVAQYAALSSRIVSAGLAQIPVSFEEAAALAGATWHSSFGRILLPLLRRSMVLSWVAACIFCLREVSLPLILAPPGYDTLTARTMTLMANGAPNLIAALCLLLIAITAIPAFIVVIILSSPRSNA
jgi:iron(III) transport system permease protein